MTEPSPPRPVPGPPRPGPGPRPAGVASPQPADRPAQSQAEHGQAPHSHAEESRAEQPVGSGDRFADLQERPVADHVTVFEAEHDRLQRELGTIDQL
jgi:hypothetical protein